ncbi:hypothetical protein [Klebsiella pneumoniae IS39]|nr:hypothetical protein [Klebsiella pneumoniae IS39]
MDGKYVGKKFAITNALDFSLKGRMIKKMRYLNFLFFIAGPIFLILMLLLLILYTD